MPHQNLSANERTTVVTVSRRSLPRPRKKRKPNKTEVVKNLIKHLTKTAMEICIRGTFKKKRADHIFCQIQCFADVNTRSLMMMMILALNGIKFPSFSSTSIFLHFDIMS